LLAHGIQPWLTFYHWDLPQALEDRFGGWTSPEIADRFADYVAYMTEHISDRVSHFMTVNELCCIIDAGYGGGGFAPGRRLERGALNQARHHALLAHGKGVQAIRAHAKTPPTVGLAENFEVCIPVYESPEHLAAARTAMRLQNALRLTAILEGAYPEQALQAEGAAAPRFTDAEMRIIGAPLDFVGVNTYTPLYVRADATQPCGYSLVPHPPSYPHMASGWLFLGPQVTYWAPRWLAEIWQVPSVYITENGCSALDKLTSEGTVLDTDRVMYLRNHFISAHRAVSEGYPLHGYFVWSLLDNFEWADGYATRFGLTYVNYHTLQRTPKLSAEFYREVIAQRRVV
jgi:beta-glucosidase